MQPITAQRLAHDICHASSRVKHAHLARLFADSSPAGYMEEANRLIGELDTLIGAALETVGCFGCGAVATSTGDDQRPLDSPVRMSHERLAAREILWESEGDREERLAAALQRLHAHQLGEKGAAA